MRPAEASNPNAVPEMLNTVTAVNDEESAMRDETPALPSLRDLLGPTALLGRADERKNL